MTEIVAKIAEMLQCSEAQARAFLDALAQIVRTQEHISIRGFGTFSAYGKRFRASKG